jgi:hypothetical protein
MRVRVLFLTSGIRAVLSCSLNISYSSPSHASLGPQPAAGTPAVPAHPSSPAQTSSSSSEAASSPRSSPALAHHVRKTVSALGRFERAAPVGGRGCHDRGTRASDDRDCSDGGKDGKAGDGGTGSNKGRSRSSKLEALCASSIGSSVSADEDRDNELKLAREVAREQTAQWAAVHPRGVVAAAQTALRAGARTTAVPLTAATTQTGVDAPVAGLTEIAAFTGGAALPPQIGTMVTMGSRPLLGTPVPTAGGRPSPRPTTSSRPR